MRAFIIGATLALAAAGPCLAADPVEGAWLNPTKQLVATIAPCAGQAAKLCAKITWLKRPVDENGKPYLDEENPVAALQKVPLMGLPMMRDFEKVETGRWKGGKIYDASSGKTYDSKMRLMDNGTLKVDGCILILCLSQTWTKPPATLKLTP